MQSNESIKEYLSILQIDNGQVLTKSYVTAKYKKLAKIKHPDKQGGTKCAFQELSEAYKNVIKFIEKNQEYEKYEEQERDFETEFFMKNNIMKEYSASYVVYIQDHLADKWKTVLEKHITVHKMDKTKIIFKTGLITLTLYIKPKKDPRSKLHIQSGDQTRNLEFIIENLSLFYKEVNLVPDTLSLMSDHKELGRSMCVRCGKYFTNKKGLKAHILRMHTSNRKKQVDNQIDQLPITLDESVENHSTKNETSNSILSLASSIRIITAHDTEDEVNPPLQKKKKKEEEGNVIGGGKTLLENKLKDMLNICPVITFDDKDEGTRLTTMRSKPDYVEFVLL